MSPIENARNSLFESKHGYGLNATKNKKGRHTRLEFLEQCPQKYEAKQAELSNQQSDAIEGEAQCTCGVQQVLKNVTFTPSHQRIFIKILIFKNNLAMRSR